MVSKIQLNAPLVVDDCAYILDWVRSAEENFNWGASSFSFPLQSKDMNVHVQASLDPNPIRKIFTATLEKTVVGHVELERINLWNASATICRVLIHPNMRGRGIGSLMMKELVRTSFEELGLSRLELFVFATNTAAIRTYQNSEFIEEGHLRKWLRHQGEFHDAKIMAVLKSDR